MGHEQGGREPPQGVDIGPYTKIPNKLFGSGTAAILGPSATVLFVALCEHANRHGKNSFSASDRAMAADTGLSPRKICDARKDLQEHGLISAVRENGRSYCYTLFKCTMPWVPIVDRPRVKQNPRALHANRIQTAAKFAMV